MRQEILNELLAIRPIDALENDHLVDAISWVKSGAELCRLAKPATPPKHLVSYIVLVDHDQLLLVDHKNARLWLPTGGHVEPNEHPRETVCRELKEELQIAPFEPIQAPLMITCTTTVGLTAGHTDVSLWYVVKADDTQELKFDPNEFNSIRWFSFADVPLEQSDPHMGRFLSKLKNTNLKQGKPLITSVPAEA